MMSTPLTSGAGPRLGSLKSPLNQLDDSPDWRSERLHSQLTVVIPAYNAAEQIEHAIASAVQVGAAKVIVVDDGSTDGTAEVAKGLGCEVISQENAGAAIARQTGVDRVSTAFTILLDSDDVLVEEGVQASLRLAESRGGWTFIAGATLSLMNGRSSLIMPWTEGIATRTLLDRAHAPGPPGAFLWNTKSLVSAMGDVPPALRPRYAEDYELLIRGSLLGEVLTHRAVSCKYSAEGGKSAVAPLRSNTSAEDIRRFYAKLTNLKIRERSGREIKSMAYLRLAYSAPSKSFERFRLYLKAGITTPLFLPRMFFRKVHRILFSCLFVLWVGRFSLALRTPTRAGL